MDGRDRVSGSVIKCDMVQWAMVSSSYGVVGFAWQALGAAILVMALIVRGRL